MHTPAPTYRPLAPTKNSPRRSASSAGVYTFSAKEKDSETGLSYFGSRYYSSDLSIWLSVDPMSDKYASLSPYVYCADNPVKLVDPNGEEVWIDIEGDQANDAFKSLQKGSTLLLSMDENGRVSAKGKPLTEHDEMLLDAINSSNVIVRVKASSSNKDNKAGGAYMGTDYNEANKTATSVSNVNMTFLEGFEKESYAPIGSGIIHEITEGYQAGLVSLDKEMSIKKAERIQITSTDYAGINHDGSCKYLITTTEYVPADPYHYSLYMQAHNAATMAPNAATPSRNFNYILGKFF